MREGGGKGQSVQDEDACWTGVLQCGVMRTRMRA